MNKRSFLISALVGLLLLGGAGFAYYTMKMNAPAFRGRAIPVKGLPDDLVKSWETAFQEALQNEEVLGAIVEESGYAEKLKIPAEEAVAHLKEAARVRLKNAKGTIEVGLVGKRKNDEALKGIALVLYEEAEKEVLEIAPSYQEYLDEVSKKR